jgi:hypothetical protein
MNHFFDGSVTNNLKDENTSVTVFRKKEDHSERLLEPFYCNEEAKKFPRQESWQKSITITVAVNTPIADKKTCNITKMEAGTYNGPTKINNFKWEVEMISSKESYSDPNATIEIEVSEKE